MRRFTAAQKDDLITKIADTATRRLTDAWQIGAVQDFIRRYYAHCPIHDIYEESSDNLFGAAFSHWQLASIRPAGVARVRTYNPRLDDHGWRCEHTIIEIVTDNMPFLVDSLTAEMNQRDLAVHLVIHPVLTVRRDGEGRLVEVRDAASGEAAGDAVMEDDCEESFIHVQINRQPDEVMGQLTEAVRAVLGDVRAAVGDWSSMCAIAQRILDELPSADGPDGDPHAEEAREFLNWLVENNFTFLGYRAYAFSEEGGEVIARVEPGSSLGILRDPDFLVFDDLRSGRPIPPPVRAFVERPDLIMVTKANRISTVHRRVHMDTIVVKRLGDGHVMGEHIIVGLFAAAAYNRSIRSIPLLRNKLDALFARTGFNPRGHDGRALTNIVENYPRDELFQVSEDYLLTTALGILNLQQRQRVAVFIRRDDFERYIAALIYIPRDRFNTELRSKIQEILEKAFDGSVTAQYSQVGDAPLARLQMYIRTTPGEIPDYDADQIEADVVEATRTWSDGLRAALIAVHGEEQGHALFRVYADAFPPGYQERFIAEEAVADIDKIEQSLVSQDLSLTLYRPFGTVENRMRFKIFQLDRSIILSTVVPMLEDLGLRVVDEVPHVVRLGPGGDRRIVMIHDFGLETRSGSGIDIGAVRQRFQETFLAVWKGGMESDRFNGLVIEGGLTCREVMVIRAYSKYLRQTGIAISETYMQQTMTRHPGLACAIIGLFTTLFDPARTEADAAVIRETLSTGLDAVASADEDRIIRRFINAVEATLRTNYFQTVPGGEGKPYLSFKIDSRSVLDLPLPRPMVEVFVYSPRMEGIHLRGGKVARGGIRWSDRREDFRTEVLGLMKAQHVKNAVIVPVGAKGGFVLKQAPNPSDREAFLAEGVACYTTLIRGLLDITDNEVKGRIVTPEGVVRRDGDDSYLVVAADKGTATFSDTANRIAGEYGFWLGDAFASGGSHGYDHKKMGITARGAWESIKRHFREIGRNIQEEDFTVVGIGDMSGDVFGNGMLLSRHIKLIAAFNHQHIFVDPDPDPEVSFVERQRIADLPRSTWMDYDRKLMSEGGAVFERRAKSVLLTPEIKNRFGINVDRMTPNELLRVLLKAEVDLMWFGGIGTFVKSSHESHAAVGDRANDAIRVDATELRCRILGEGGNLGITQLGRVQFARGGGRINTDFIDNSAGVDCSDHEVNIKILLDAAIADGDMTGKQRNILLGEMTNEVADLVLRDNYLQSQAISLIAEEGFGALENQARLARMLERQGRLNREVEALPDEEALSERVAAREGLTRPEIAVLFSHCKIWLYDEVLDSDLPEDRHLAEDVERYFPTPIQNRFPRRISDHRLRRELIATAITNSLINRVGGTFVTEIRDKTGMSAVDITRAYIIARDVFSARGAWEEIEALDNKVPAQIQTGLHREVQRMIERATMWFLRNGGSPIDITVNVEAFKTAVHAFAGMIRSVLPQDLNDRILARTGHYLEAGVPGDLAERIAYMIVMPSACDIVRIAAARGIAMEDVASLYFNIGEYLGFGWLRSQAEALAATSHWQKLAVAAIIEELYGHQRDLTVRVLDTGGKSGDGAVEEWAETCGPAVDRMRVLMGELDAAAPVDLSMLTVASRQLGTLTQS